jgi:hypothetical protein
MYAGDGLNYHRPIYSFYVAGTTGRSNHIQLLLLELRACELFVPSGLEL